MLHEECVSSICIVTDTKEYKGINIFIIHLFIMVVDTVLFNSLVVWQRVKCSIFSIPIDLLTTSNKKILLDTKDLLVNSIPHLLKKKLVFKKNYHYEIIKCFLDHIMNTQFCYQWNEEV